MPRYRTFRSLFEDNFNGVTNHYRSELVNRKPLESRLVQLPKSRQIQVGRQAASVKLGKAFLGKLKGLGIK